MSPHDDAWLRHQQRRWMRPDAARYLRPDAARFLKPGTDPAEVYPALELKYPGQPRLPKGGKGPGRFTFGKRDSAASESTEGRARVIITKPDPPAETTDEDRTVLPTIEVLEDPEPASIGLDFLSSFWSGLDSILGSISDGIQGGPEQTPPSIPKEMPNTRTKRMAFVRNSVAWIYRNAVRRAPLVEIFLGAIDEFEELGRLAEMIKTGNDRAQTFVEAQRRVRSPSEKGYHDHHIVNQHEYNRLKFGDARIDSIANQVRIPILQHIEISRWYSTKNKDYGDRPPQDVLRDKDWDEQTRVGLDLLRKMGILK